MSVYDDIRATAENEKATGQLIAAVDALKRAHTCLRFGRFHALRAAPDLVGARKVRCDELAAAITVCLGVCERLAACTEGDLRATIHGNARVSSDEHLDLQAARDAAEQCETESSRA